MKNDAPKPVVLGPDILLRALHCPEEYRILQLWRDGRLLPIVTRPLLLHYLKLLRKAGIEEKTLKKWVLWLTSKEKARYVETEEASDVIGDLLFDAAQLGEAEVVASSMELGGREVASFSILKPKELSAQLD